MLPSFPPIPVPTLETEEREDRGKTAFANSRVRFRESEGGIPHLTHSVWNCSERGGRDGSHDGQGRVPDRREKVMEGF